MERQQVCPQCQKVFLTRRSNKIYCSKSCKNKKMYVARSAYPDLPTGTVGAISELAVSCDLLRRGFEVFRALSSSCSCDLAILWKGTHLRRVEVRTGYENPSTGKQSTCRTGIERCDIFAIVYPSGIVYEPPLD
jgi:hypothetical protein